MKSLFRFAVLSTVVLGVFFVAFAIPQRTMAQDESLIACFRLSVTAGPATTVPDGSQANIFSVVGSLSSSIISLTGFELHTPGEVVVKYFRVTGDEFAFLSSSSGDLALGSLSGTLIFGNGSVQVVDDDLCFGIHDGRLNPDDMATLAAVYPASSGDGYEVWAIDPQTSEGTLLFTLSQKDINAALANASQNQQNQVINAAGGVTLYALASNECQLNYVSQDGQNRSFIFACAS